MAGIRIYNVDLNGIQLSKGMTVQEFKSWIVGTIGGSGSDRYFSVIQRSDGGYLAVGDQNSQALGELGGTDAQVVKYDSNLNVTNQHALGVGSNNEIYRSVIQSSDGGYVAVGSQDSQGQGGDDALIVKYDSNINVVATKSLGGLGNDRYLSVTQSHDGGYIAVGYQDSQSQGGYDALIVKYDSNLNVVTQKSLGGLTTDRYYSVIQSADGGYIAVGDQNSQGQGNNDALLVKYDSNLNVINQYGLGGESADYYRSICESHDSGGYVVVGFQRSQSQGYYDTLIVKYDSNLNVVTQKSLGGLGDDRYLSVTQSHDGGYIAVGYQDSQGEGGFDALLVKYDSNLNLVTQKGLGGIGNDYYRSICESHDSGYIVVGYQDSQGEGGFDGLISKIPSDLDLIDNGSLVNHSGIKWYTSTLTVSTPTLIETNPTLTVSTPTLIESSPTITVSTPTLTATRSEKQ